MEIKILKILTLISLNYYLIRITQHHLIKLFRANSKILKFKFRIHLVIRAAPLINYPKIFDFLFSYKFAFFNCSTKNRTNLISTLLMLSPYLLLQVKFA